MEKLSQMPNIGPALEEQLMRVGIDTPEQLIKIGSREAWCRIKQIDASACIHRLYALEGAVQGIRKNLLPQEVKASLKAFYNENK